MVDIKNQYRIVTPSIDTPGVRPARVEGPGGVPRSRRQRAFEGEGMYLAGQGLAQFSQGLKEMGQVMARYEATMSKVKADDYAATLRNKLNQRYINDVTPLKGVEAEGLFGNEVSQINDMREDYLSMAGSNERLRNIMSIEFNKLTQEYLGKVLTHKLQQDDVYRQEIEWKNARVFQSEAAMQNIGDINNVFQIAKEVDEKIKDPTLEQATKLSMWQGFFKSNSRVNPDYTERVYANEDVKKKITDQIGAEGYNSIQKQIDEGRAFKEHQERWRDYQTEKERKIREEAQLNVAFTEFVDGTLTYGFLDKLDISPESKKAWSSMVDRIAQRKDNVDTDYPTLARLWELSYNPEAQGLEPIQVYNEIIGAIGESINSKQGEALIKSFSNRNRFNHPIITDARKELVTMFGEGKFEDYTDYTNAVTELEHVIRSTDGNEDKVREYMHDILLPKVKRNVILRSLEGVGILKDMPDYVEQGTTVDIFTLPGEKERVNEYLVKEKMKDDKGNQITFDRLTDNDKRDILKYLRVGGE